MVSFRYTYNISSCLFVLILFLEYQDVVSLQSPFLPSENTKIDLSIETATVVSRRRVLQRTTAAAVAGRFGGGMLLTLTTAPASSHALTAQQAATDYDTYAASYDTLDGGAAASALGLDDARAALLQQASGDVLEIGVGTGLNLGFYDWSSIKSLTCVDISEGMLKECQNKYQALLWNEQATARNSSRPPVRFVTADATRELETRFGQGSFDTAIDTFSLCVMGNQGAVQCLNQLRAVVRPGGNLLLLENTRSDNGLLAAYQDLTATSAAAMGGKGCVYNQNVGNMLAETTGLRIRQQQSYATGLFRAFTVERI
eukprot:scaffold8832_cov139-Amphora_coffeaeformis.AAC.4